MRSRESRGPGARKKRIRRLAAAGLGIAALLLPLAAPAGVGSPEDEEGPSVVRTVLAANVFADVDLKDAQSAMEIWFENIRKRMRGGNVNDVVIAADNAQVQRLVRERDVHFVVLLAEDYLDLKDRSPFEPVYLAGDRRSLDEFVLVVRRAGRITGLDGLEGKRLLIQAGGLGKTPRRWLDILLMKRGLLPARRLCGSVELVPKASRAVLPVFFGRADACIVLDRAYRTMVELNPQLGVRLATIVKSPGFARVLCCFGPGWPAGMARYRNRLRDEILNLHKDPAGKHILNLFGHDRLSRFDPSDLESLRLISRDWRKLTGEGKHGARTPAGELDERAEPVAGKSQRPPGQEERRHESDEKPRTQAR